MANVEMPDGTTRSYSSKTITDLKERVAVSIGVEADELAILDDSGRPLADDQTVPASSRVIPKPKWGRQ